MQRTAVDVEECGEPQLASGGARCCRERKPVAAVARGGDAADRQPFRERGSREDCATLDSLDSPAPTEQSEKGDCLL